MQAQSVLRSYEDTAWAGIASRIALHPCAQFLVGRILLGAESAHNLIAPLRQRNQHSRAAGCEFHSLIQWLNAS
jgi:hypothetical protein